MTVFEMIKSHNIEELVEWLDGYEVSDNTPWIKWWDENYCKKCEAEVDYVPALDAECECAWCELNGKCKFFKDMDDIPDNKTMIKMWLESECE